MNDDVNLIALAIPAFLVLILLEIVASRIAGQDVYRFDDAVTDLGCGIGQQATGVFGKIVVLLAYVWVFDNLAVWELPGTWWGWALATLAVDFAYYWWHRASHRINVMWAAHVVHHQSQDYNLAVALRQAWFTKFTTLPFHLPLAIAGIPPVMFFVSDAINTLYQFWIHTELVPKIPVVGLVMNTPSHHRVHHGINPEYIDRNHAGIFIIWDRMFGTFEPEQAPVVYGTVTPYTHWDSVWAHFDYWHKLWGLSRSAPTWQGKLWAWFAPPEWRPDGDVTIPPVDRGAFVKHSTPTPLLTQVYVGLHFFPVVGVVVALLLFEKTAPWFDLGVGVALVLLTLQGWAALLDGRESAREWEWMRLVLVGASALVYLQGPLLIGAIGLVLVSGVLLWRVSAAPAVEPAAAK